MKIDEIDKKILNELIINSKLSYRDIAKNVKVSTVTVMNRIKKLQKEKIIKKYVTIIDYEKLMYDFEIIVEMRISNGKLFEVEKKISSHPNVFKVIDITGDFDALVFARFTSRARMDTFIKKIQTHNFIERIKTRIILNNISNKEQLIK
jgi:Lrp/AsnC family transcriptional regulator, regulator for asnA, asnC and gidA